MKPSSSHPLSSLCVARALALATPVLLLGGALVSQYVGGLYPCEMCMWQRWPHVAAIALALIAYGLRNGRACISGLFAGLAGLAIALSGVIGAFHAGVEYGWWQGLTACSTSISGSTGNVMDAIMAAPITRCDVAPWSLFGISLAGFNALFSLGGAALIGLSLLRWKKETA